MAIRKIIMVGSQDEIFEELPPDEIELYVIQQEALIGPNLRKAAKAIWPISAFTPEKVLAAAQEITQLHSITALFSFTEYGLLPAAQAAKTLGLPGIDLSVTDLCRNKWRLREKLASTPLHVPFVMAEREGDIAQFADTYGFPLVLKDPSGVGSINVKICASLNEARTFLHYLQQQQNYRQVLVEKFVGGTEYSVETLTLRGEHQLIGVTDKRLLPGSLVEQCHIYPAALPEQQFVLLARYIATLLDEIGHRHGPMHIEVKLQGDDIQLIEINNRPGGDYIWDMVNKVSGVNLVAETLRYAFSGQPDAQMRRQRQRYGAMSYIALFHAIPPQEITQALADKVRLDRVQCRMNNGQPLKAIDNSFERPGFILIGEREPAALRSALPLVERWIDSQNNHEENRA